MLDQLATQVKQVSETTKEEIRDLVSQQAKEGWSTERLADKIRMLGFDHADSRAKAVARTESATAYTQGSLIAYQEIGLQEVVWLASANSCPTCTALNGKKIKIADGPFPPKHPYCTCAVAPVLA